MKASTFLRHVKASSSIIITSLTVISGLFVPYSPCVNDTLQLCKNHPTLPESIICENIQDIRTFIHVLRCNRMKKMQEVFLVESTIEYLPLYTLDFCGITFLNLRTVSMTKLLDGNDMIRLEQLHLDNVTISTPWSWEPLGVLARLLRFSVANMAIEILNESLVDHLNENLQSFILTSTNTTLMAHNALSKFQDLIYVSIQNNEIRQLKRSMFPIPSKIKYFYFGKNRITSLPEDIFYDMPDLQVVSLQDNLISEIHELTFRRIWHQLAYVLLEGNPLKCNCKMLWLSKRNMPSVFQGECYAPKMHFGKELKSLKLSDFRCF